MNWGLSQWISPFSLSVCLLASHAGVFRGARISSLRGRLSVYRLSYYLWLILECIRTNTSLEKLCRVEQMGYLIRMYAVFDLPGKFHFVSSSYFNTNPISTPSHQHTSRSLIVNGWPSRGGGENMITSKLSQSPSLLFSELPVSHSLLPQKKKWNNRVPVILRTELKMV